MICHKLRRASERQHSAQHAAVWCVPFCLDCSVPSVYSLNYKRKPCRVCYSRCVSNKFSHTSGKKNFSLNGWEANSGKFCCSYIYCGVYIYSSHSSHHHSIVSIIHRPRSFARSGHLIVMRNGAAGNQSSPATPPPPISGPGPSRPRPTRSRVRCLCTFRLASWSLPGAPQLQHPAYWSCEEKISRSELSPIRSHPSSTL